MKVSLKKMRQRHVIARKSIGNCNPEIRNQYKICNQVRKDIVYQESEEAILERFSKESKV